MTKILAVVTCMENPRAQAEISFYAKDEKELQDLSFRLEKILDATAHDLGNGTMVIVKH